MLRTLVELPESDPRRLARGKDGPYMLDSTVSCEDQQDNLRKKARV